MSNNIKLNKLYELAYMNLISKAIHVAAELKFDQILSVDNFILIDELAISLDFDPDGLRKLLRLLDAYEIITVEMDRVKANEYTRLLNYVNSPHINLGYKFSDLMAKSYRTNMPIFNQAFGTDFYPYIVDNNMIEEFRRWCSDTAKIWLPVVLDMYNFDEYANLIDIGGGEGYLVGIILEKYKHLKATLFDQESVIAEAYAILNEYHVVDRVSIMPGDFFNINTIPREQDLYIICRVLLNWSDKDAITILNNCYEAMGPNSKLLIIDFYLPDKHHPQYKRTLLSDSLLFMGMGSSNRTLEEWFGIVNKSKLTISKTYLSDDCKTKFEPIIPLCIIETIK